MLTACNDDDDDDDLTETVDDDDDSDDSSSDSDNSETTDTINGYEYVDLGLSVKSGSVNIGATLPADYGNYYAWGETETKDEYTEDNSVTYSDSSIEDFAGNVTYDAATANWGGTWRMPTEAEFRELINNCIWTWTTQENSNGRTIRGYEVKGSTGNSIFLPAAGFRFSTFLLGAGPNGNYWSSVTDNSGSNYACYLGFFSIIHYVSYSERFWGGSVRPVSE